MTCLIEHSVCKLCADIGGGITTDDMDVSRRFAKIETNSLFLPDVVKDPVLRRKQTITSINHGNRCIIIHMMST